MTGIETRIDAIESFIADEMAASEAPGLAISVVQDGKVALERGYGYADLATRTPMTERTGVVVGSTTKALSSRARGCANR
jgi:CubicO group peptidase (beta-lactamase class C family)